MCTIFKASVVSVVDVSTIKNQDALILMILQIAEMTFLIRKYLKTFNPTLHGWFLRVGG